MAGCYGSDPEDRYFEAMLFRYLEEQDYNSTEEEEYEDMPDIDDAVDTYPSPSEK